MMAIIQRFDGMDWQYVTTINTPSVADIITVAWGYARHNPGTAYRVLSVQKRRGADEPDVELLTPILCAATMDVRYEREFTEHPQKVLVPNLRQN